MVCSKVKPSKCGFRVLYSNQTWILPRSFFDTEHPNGDLVTIYYVTDPNGRGKRKEAILDDGRTILERMIKAGIYSLLAGFCGVQTRR